MKENQVPSQSGLAAAGTSERSFSGVAPGNAPAPEATTLAASISLAASRPRRLYLCHEVQQPPARQERQWWFRKNVWFSLTAFRCRHTSLHPGLWAHLFSYFTVYFSWCHLPVSSSTWCSPTIASSGNPPLDWTVWHNPVWAMPVPSACWSAQLAGRRFSALTNSLGSFLES